MKSRIKLDVPEDERALEDEHGKRKTKKQGKKILIGAAALVVIGLATWGVIVLIGILSSNKSSLEANLETLGKDFYETFYYDQIAKAYDDERLKEFLKSYSTLGIKISLDNFNHYQSKNLDNKALVEEFKNNKTDQPCDKTESKVTVFPQEPFGQKDYKIEAKLVCGFDEN